MGKFLAFVVVATLLSLTLGLGALLVPIEGRAVLQRLPASTSRELPRAALRAVAHGLRAGWDWVSSSRPAAASATSPTHQPPAHSPPRQTARRQLLAAAPPAVSEAHDGIVKAPPTEQHAAPDRAALDKLVQSR